MEPKNPIIVDGVDVSECECFYINDSHPEWKECINPYCKGLCKDNSNCHYKQLQRKEKENQRYEQTLIVIEDIAKADFNHTCWETYARQLKQIIQEVRKVLDE